MSKDKTEKISLSDIENGDELMQLVEMLPLLLKIKRTEKELLDQTAPSGSQVVAAELEK